MNKSKEFSFHYQVLESESELSEIERELLARAKAINPHAYAPYSNFHVSACAYLSTGEFVEGVNQENVAYPSGLCAERVALFRIGAQFPGAIVEKILIMGRYREGDWQYISPCGACRQVMLEFENRQKQDIEVILYMGSYLVKIKSIKDLLPFSFVKEDLSR